MALGLCFDKERALLVAARNANPQEDEYQDYLTAMEDLDAAAVASGESAISILVVTPDTPSPPAGWRRRYAESAQNSVAIRFMALVSASRMQRGVITAIRWLSGRKQETLEAFSTFEAACAAAEVRRGHPLPELWDMLRKAEAALAEAA